MSFVKCEMENDIMSSKAFSNKKIQVIEAQKLLFNEYNHQVKNNLSHLISFIRISKEKPTKKVLSELEIKISLMNCLYDYFLSDPPESLIGIRSCLQHVCDLIVKINQTPHQTVKVTVKGKEIYMSFKRISVVCKIFSELLTNSYKHSFVGQQKCAVNIGIEEKDDDVEVSYSEVCRNNKVSQLTPKNMKRKVHGRKIITSLAEQIGAEIFQCDNFSTLILKIHTKNNSQTRHSVKINP